MEKVISIDYNWRQVGSLQDRDGCNEDYNRFAVGQKGVTLIEENEPRNGNEVWNYVIHFEDGTKNRVFNPNLVVYSSKKDIN